MHERLVPVWLMRGGTSKAAFFMADDVPDEGPARTAFLTSAMGSDGRQIDGLGGGNPLTSKCVVIDRPADPRADLTASFYQVGIGNGRVQPTICGNITPAVGLFAMQRKLVAPARSLTHVRIYVTHVRRVVEVDVPTSDESAATSPQIGGDPGTGPRITVDWSTVVGIETGGLIPTGSTSEPIEVPEVGPVRVSVIDCGNPVVFIPAQALGLGGTAMPSVINADRRLLARAEAIRSTVGKILGASGRTKLDGNLGHPMLALVSEPTDYETALGTVVPASAYDVASRVMFMQRMHDAYPASAALCTVAAGQIPGTIVNEIVTCTNAQAPHVVRIGHPAGVTSASVRLRPGSQGYEVLHARYERTARCLLEGKVSVRW